MKQARIRSPEAANDPNSGWTWAEKFGAVVLIGFCVALAMGWI